MNDRFDAKMLGVLGGMGPMAGAVFLERLTALTEASRDQEHIPTVLWSDPRVPDRTAAWLAGGEDPLPWLLNGIRRLEQAGAKAIAIPCNTAHLWYTQMANATMLPVLHIVEATVEDLKRQGLAGGKIGVMGSAGTLTSGLYQQRLEACGYEWVTPSDEEIEESCTPAISLVKANRTAEAYEPAAGCVRGLIRRGAIAVVLGCTELPLAIPHARRREFGVEFSDSIDGLARAAIRWYFGGAG